MCLSLLVLCLCSLIPIDAVFARQLDRHTVQNERGEEVVFYINRVSAGVAARDLTFWVQGSSAQSVLGKQGMCENVLPQHDIVYVEKYRVDDLEEFYKHDCRQRRIADISLVLKHLLRQKKRRDVFLIGTSEGGAIVPEIAYHHHKEVTRLLIMGSGGMSQADELRILAKRGSLASSGISSLSELESAFKNIVEDSSSNQRWFGHTHKRWFSYLWYSPAKFIARLRCPTLVVMGDADENAPFESAQSLLRLAQSRHWLWVHIAPGLDHSFKDKDGKLQLQQLAIKVIIPWVMKTTPPSK